MDQSYFIRKDRSAKVLVFLVAICYGLMLASLPINAFVDRDNYLTYASASLEIALYYLDQGIWSALFNEPVWLVVNALLGALYSPENVLRILIFFSSLMTAYMVLRHDVKYFVLLILILFLPQVLKNNIIHLRQGLAIAVFLCGWFSGIKNIRYGLFLLACLIHSSFFIVMFLMALNDLLVRLRLGAELRTVVIVMSGVFVGFLGLWIAGLLGARQANEYTSDGAAVSGLAFAFWASIAVLFFLQGRRFLYDNSLQYSIIIFYLSTYFLLPVTARVFESGILLVFLSLLGLTSYRKYLFILALLFYFILQWAPRLILPGFGWGIENYI